MPSYAFVSAKGSPGATTVAAALAAVAAVHSQSVLVELDPAGGTVQMLARGSATSGLVEAATQLRRDPHDLAAVRDSTVELPPGVRTVLAPTAGHAAESVVRSLGTRWLPVLGACAPLVFVDCGRWALSQRSASRVGGADLVVVVCHPTIESVEHTRHIIQPLREAARQQVAVVVIGAKPYSPEEVAHHLGAPLAGGIAWDPRSLLSFWARGSNRTWLRSRLARSAAATLQGLLAVQTATPALEASAGAPPRPLPGDGALATPAAGTTAVRPDGQAGAPPPAWPDTDPDPSPDQLRSTARETLRTASREMWR
jgi:Flp pilus assembly CpaE family ATPase